jgi:hypothetical protein
LLFFGSKIDIFICLQNVKKKIPIKFILKVILTLALILSIPTLLYHSTTYLKYLIVMRHLLFTALILACTSCANYVYQPAATQPENTELAYVNGLATTRAQVSDANVTVQLRHEGGRGVYDLNLFLRNLGEENITFFPEQVNVYGYNKKGEVQKLKVFTADEFVRRRRRNNAIVAGVVVAATVATAVAVSESNNNNHDTPHHHHNDNNDWWLYSALTPMVVLNNGYAPVVVGPYSAPFVAPDRLVRRHTLYAEEALQGIIKIKRESGFDERFLVEVPVNGQYAKFVFDAKMRLRN